MELIFDIRGHACDLALHPVSSTIAEKIRVKGLAFYKEKYMNWWRKGKTATCGMRIDDDMVIRVSLDGKLIPFDESVITNQSVELRRRMFIESKASYLSVLGYDNEPCGCVWKWKNIESFDPKKLDFLVQRWDRIMGIPNYYIVDNVTYDGVFADEHTWCDSKGFSLLEPIVIDLDAVRREWAAKESAAAAQ
jgi:hypothetical protein